MSKTKARYCGRCGCMVTNEDKVATPRGVAYRCCDCGHYNEIKAKEVQDGSY